jgi:hypothetical protein
MSEEILSFGLFCIEDKIVIAPANLDAHIIDHPDHHYVEVMYRQGSQAPTAIVEAVLDTHPQDLGNPHQVSAHQIGAATTVDVAQIHAMIAEGMAIMLAHNESQSNPHAVTPAQIGAATPSQVAAHANATNNPHNTTAGQVGAIPTSEKGAANGVPYLDQDGKILPSFIPAGLLPKFSVVADEAARLALTPKEGDECKQLSDDSDWIYGDQWYQRSTNQGITPYGSVFKKAESAAVSTTTWADSDMVSKVSMNTGVLPLGDYKVEVSYGWNHNHTASSFVSALLLDGVQLGESHVQEPKDSGGYFMYTGTSQRHYVTRVFYLDQLSGDHVLDLRYGTDQNGKESSIWDASISILRVA